MTSVTLLIGIAVWAAGIPAGSPASAGAEAGLLAQNRGQVFMKGSEAPIPEPPPKGKRAVAAPPSAWPAGLNAFFGSHLENPTPDQIMAALAGSLNRWTLIGVEPEAEYERFSEWLKKFRKTLPKHEVETEPVDAFYRNLTEWVRLEAEYTRKPSRSVLKDLVKLVDNEARQDPGLDAERKERIVNTIESQSLFVPSSILFGLSVLPYRPVKLPRGYGIFEVLGTPAFEDTSHRARALYDFLECPGPVFRIDFDTVGTKQFSVEMGEEVATLRPVAAVKSAAPEGVRGPVILQKPHSARMLRLTAESANDQAVLRNPRVFALKEPAAAICSLTGEAPVLDALFREPCWPETAQIMGFIDPSGPAFAEAQTTVRLCYTRDALYVGVYAREPRMSTLVARMTARDAPLESEESVELDIQPPGKPLYRFLVNPKGAQFDSRDGKAQWDGAWQVVAKSYPTGWAAEIAIPFATLGGPPRGKDWVMNCIRYRRNVKDERSVWAYTNDRGEEATGSLIFN